MERPMSFLLLSLAISVTLGFATDAAAAPLPNGNIRWAFEGTATTPGSPYPVIHSVVGTLEFGSLLGTTIGVDALVDGVDRVRGSILAVSFDGAAQDRISLPYTFVLFSPYGHEPDSVNYFLPMFGFNLTDVDGTLFDGTFPLPPAYAPDISRFAVAELSILQETCSQTDDSSPCPFAGVHSVDEVFHLTFTSFSEPVPEPAGNALASLLALAGLAVVRQARAAP